LRRFHKPASILHLPRRSRCGPIGLDVGCDGIRMLQLVRRGHRLSVQWASRWHFPRGASEGGEDDPQRLRAAVRAVTEMLRDGGFRGREVVSCLRAPELSIKNVRLPHMPEHELANAVIWEGRERFGFEVGPDRLHYINAGEARQGAEVRDEIILLGARKETVDRHLEMLSAMRLRPAHIDTEPTALFRAYRRLLGPDADPSAIRVVVDVGLGATKIVVFKTETIVLIKTLDLGGRRLNESVAKELGLSYAEAAHLRRRSRRRAAAGEQGGRAETDTGGPADAPTTGEPDWPVFDAIRGQVEALAREVALCLRYCSVTFRGLRPGTITLTGGEAYDPAVRKVLSDHLGCECLLGRPLDGIDVGEVDLCGEGESAGTEWSIATGLALRGVMGADAVGESGHARAGIPA